MTDKKEKSIHGGDEDGIGIAQDVRESSTKKNDLKSTASAAGKVLKQPGSRGNKK